MKKKVMTIDCTPTWQAAAQIYLAVLENGSEEGKKQAREGIMHMARIAQAFVGISSAHTPDNVIKTRV